MTVPLDIYPISEKAPEKAISASGMALDRLTLKSVVSGRVGPDDIRISADVLEAPAGIARAAGRDRLALNLERAAELVDVPQDVILETDEIYALGVLPTPTCCPLGRKCCGAITAPTPSPH